MGCQQSSELRDEYEGERNLNALRHGQGRMMYADGHEYEGAWYQGVMHGFGTKVWSNGDSYEGNWTCGKREGEGRFER